MDSKTHVMASMEESNIEGQNENKKSRLPEHESVEVSGMKAQLGSSYVFTREIRPKDQNHMLRDPPMKKAKIDIPITNLQNGFPSNAMMNIHNNVSMQVPSNPLSKLHELNKNINSTSFTSNKIASSSFASIVHSDGPNPLFPNGIPAAKKPTFSTSSTVTTNGVSSEQIPQENGKMDAGYSSILNTTELEKSSSSNGAAGVEGQNDGLSSLEWKDGIADLPGSKLKFKMTEFGLEIISTVETEDGQVEFSTTSTSADQNVKKETMSNQPGDVKDETDDDDSSSKKLLEGPPDSDEFCCCEICGKYGLRSEFGASGRFCGLTCVGVYTGRRNKGREMSRHVKAFDGKIIKRKKRKGRKLTVIKQSSLNGKLKIRADGTEDRTKVKGKFQADYLNTGLDASNPPKPFNWSEYLEKTGTQAAEQSVFKQENHGRELFIEPAVEFQKDMKLEAVDSKHPSYFCVVTVAEVKGARLRLHFDGWSESYDFWANADSEFIFPVNWCSKNNQALHPPRSMTPNQFNWEKYLKDTASVAAPEHLFIEPPPTKHGFKKGMKLEAIDRKNPDLICVATVTNVFGDRFLVHFDEWDDTYDYWCNSDCPYIHVVGWCNSQGRRLTPPNDDEVDTFVWSDYIRRTGSKAASPDLFKQKVSTGFTKRTKLEVVDRRNPSLIRVGSVATVEDYKVKIHFDGWDDIYDDLFDTDSSDIHPIGWCEKSNYPLEAPITAADKQNTVSCPTPGCRGIGHVKGAKYTTHHSQFGCPYSLQNLSKESCLVDRLAANSMAEDSDWSYERRKNSVGRQTKVHTVSNASTPDTRPPSPGYAEGLGVCPTPACDGSGHITGKFSSHHSISGCPLNEANREKMYKPILPKTSHMSYQKSYMKGHKSSRPSIITTRSTTKSDTIPSYKTRSKHDQGIQVETASKARSVNGHGSGQSSRSLLSFSLYNNVYNSGVSPHVNHGARSSERETVLSWTCEQVAEHVRSIGCPNQAQTFIDQQIDGEAFLLLQQADLVNILKIKLGPAVKIYSSILKFL